MPLFVHIAPEPVAKRIRRNGIAASRREHSRYGAYDRFVWAFPILQSHTLTRQWARELKRLGARTLVAVTIRLPDDEPVFAHHYNTEPQLMTAAEAVAVLRVMYDPRGGQVVIPRRIRPDEIVRLVPMPRAIGWRYSPDVKSANRRPCECPMCAPRGEVKARRYRDRISHLARRWDERHAKR